MKTWCYSPPHASPKYNSQKNSNDDAKSYGYITTTHSQDTLASLIRPISSAKPTEAKE